MKCGHLPQGVDRQILQQLESVVLLPFDHGFRDAAGAQQAQDLFKLSRKSVKEGGMAVQRAELREHLPGFDVEPQRGLGKFKRFRAECAAGFKRIAVTVFFAFIAAVLFFFELHPLQIFKDLQDLVRYFLHLTLK